MSLRKRLNDAHLPIMTFVIILCLLLLGYTYIGYPVLLWLFCRLYSKKPSVASPVPSSVSVVICARNADNCVHQRLSNLTAQQSLPDAYEIILVSDGSTDRTATCAREFAPHITVHEIANHVGKAEALNQGVALAHGDIVVFGDVRQTYAPDAIRQLLNSFADPAVGAVSGELLLDGTAAARTQGVGLYWTLEKWMRKRESQLHSTCGCTGAIYAIRRELFLPLKPGTILDDVAIPMQIVLQGKRVIFNGQALAYDHIAGDFAEESRRKVRTLAGNLQLCRLYPALLDPLRNPIWVQFVSHKLLRLVCPWALVLLLTTSVWTCVTRPHPAVWVLACAQLAFFALAGIGAVWRCSHMPRLLAVPLAFTVLNWNAAQAWFVFFRGGDIGKWKTARTAG